MNSKLIVEGDLEVSIKRIRQRHTYEGQLEGYPNKKVNGYILEDVKKEATDYCGLKEVFIVEPKQTPVTNSKAFPFPDAIELPSVVCIAELWYFGTFRNKTMDCSSLGLVWFQNDFAFPIDQEILDKIKEIPFSKICREFDLM